MTLRRANMLLLIAAVFALAIRALVPAGFMPGTHDGRITLDICTGHGPMKVELGGKPVKQLGEVGAPCAFAGMTAPLMPGTPLALLTLAIAFIVAVGFAPRVGNFTNIAYRLRPPLRAPPAA